MTTNLFAGYKRVDSFDEEDDEYESESEVSFVTLDLGAVDPTLVPSSSNFKLIGLDTPTPFLQLSGSIFQGQHSSLLGSEIIFTHSPLTSTSSLQPGDDPDTNKPRPNRLQHVALTSKRIQFKQVQLKPKSDQGAPGSAENELIPEEPPRAETKKKGNKGKARAKGKAKGKGKGKEKADESWVDTPTMEIDSDVVEMDDDEVS